MEENMTVTTRKARMVIDARKPAMLISTGEYGIDCEHDLLVREDSETFGRNSPDSIR